MFHERSRGGPSPSSFTLHPSPSPSPFTLHPRPQVAERQDFLDAMRAMGRAAEHEAVISGEIRDRLNDLKVLDRIEPDTDRTPTLHEPYMT